MIKSNRFLFLFLWDFCSLNSKSAIRNSQCAILLGAMLFALSFSGVLLLALCSSVEAQQQTAKVPRIGFVSGTGEPQAPGPQVGAFRRGLRDLNYIEGKTIQVEYRYVAGKLDRVPGLVAELVQLKVDLLVTGNTSAIHAAKQPGLFPLSWSFLKIQSRQGWLIAWRDRAEI
jgi:hypothetical protein